MENVAGQGTLVGFLTVQQVSTLPGLPSLARRPYNLNQVRNRTDTQYVVKTSCRGNLYAEFEVPPRAS
jgi:hypothetical protein